MHIMAEPARDTDGAILGTSLSTRQARIDIRADGSFFIEAHPILEREGLIELRALIEEALRRSGNGSVVPRY